VGVIAEQGWELVEEINLAPEIEEIYAVDTIDNEANLGILSSKGFLQNPKSSGIFSLTHATRSLGLGVWFSGVPSQQVTVAGLYQLAVACSDCGHR
jgi:hypothetical protein